MLSLGPVPLDVALAMLAIALAIGVARLWPLSAKADRRVAGAVVTDAVLVGLLASRALFVVRHASDYLTAPLSVLRLGDGGFDVIGFLVAALVWSLAKLRASHQHRAAVVAAALAGSLCWFGGGLALQHWQAEHVPLPRITLQDMQGATVELGALAGKPVVLNLWASWCGPCVREMPVLAQAQQRHQTVHFVFINQGEDSDTIAAFLAVHAPHLRNALKDESSDTSTALGVQAYPSTLFFNADGRLSELHLGELSAGAIEQKLGRLR